MASGYLSPPVRRTVPPDANGFPSSKRSKPSPIPPGQVSFRLLCHASLVGGVIGKSGTVIKQLQQQTGAKIRIEEAPSDCPDRVISVVGPKGEGIEVSKAQEALVRVFERVLEVAAESEGNKAVTVGGIVSCRMLAEASHVGAVIGKGGKVVEKIKKDCGVKIRVMAENLPSCAGAADEVIEIDGDVLAIKKALVAVSRCLQECQPSDKTKMTVPAGQPVQVPPQVTLPEVRVNIAPQHNSVLPAVPNSTFKFIAGSTALPSVSDQGATVDYKAPQKEVIFRFLCPKDRVGGVIGKGGNIIKALQNETGASVTIGPTLADCDERLITITALENPEYKYSAAQKTVVLVFSMSVEAGSEKGLDSGLNKGSSVTARLVISSNQVGCLLGKGGAVVSEMRKATGAGIQILNQVPKCAPENDQVVQISGDTQNVKDAIYHVTGRLRDNLFSSTLNTLGTRGTSSLLTEASSLGGLRDSFKDPLRDVFMDPIRDSFNSSLRNALREPVRDPFIDPFRNALRDPLRDTFRDPLRETLRDPISTLTEPSREVVRDPAPHHLASSIGISHALGHHTNLTQGLDNLGTSHVLDRPPRLWVSPTLNGVNLMGNGDVGRGSAPFRGGLELGSGSKSAIVTNTTVEIVVPENVFAAVYGENGSNLTRLRQISGAKVIVHEPRLGTRDRIVVISGTPDETQAAQSLLQAFILTGQS